MPKPRRIQLSRRKGFKLPPNTVVVSRPSKFGNPFKANSYDVRGHDGEPLRPKSYREEEQRALATRDHFMWLGAVPEGEAIAERARVELRGKNLACWCPLPERGEPDYCHAANLLEVANDGVIVVRPVKLSNSSVLGYTHAVWLKRWWAAEAKWDQACPSRDRGRSGTVYKTSTVGSCATLHVPCGPRKEHMSYRVRSRVQVGDKLKGKHVVRSWAERVDGAWCWIYEVGNV